MWFVKNFSRSIYSSLFFLIPLSATLKKGSKNWDFDFFSLSGKTLISNLFAITGHGSKGWTLSFGSCALLADLIDGKTPEVLKIQIWLFIFEFFYIKNMFFFSRLIHILTLHWGFIHLKLGFIPNETLQFLRQHDITGNF